MNDAGDAPQRIGTVLLIDDERADQVLFKIILDRSGLVDRFIGFRYAHEALEFLKRTEREKVDLILLDINLPRMNGYEFLDAAQAELGDAFAAASVVMLTSSLNPSDSDRATGYSVVKGYLGKPLTDENVTFLATLASEGQPF